MKRIYRLKFLIEKKATGSPKDLARTLEISERTLYRLISDVKDLYGLDIVYSSTSNSYIIQNSDGNDRPTENDSV